MKTTQKARLALAVLEREMETLDYKQSLVVLGGSDPSNPGYWGWVDDEYVFTLNGGTLDEITITAGEQGTGYSTFDVVSGIVTSFGAAADHASISATIMKLDARTGFATASKRFGIAGAVLNAVDVFQDPNWEDAGQIALGIAVIGTGGWVAFGLGTALTAWEIYEMYTDNHGGS